MSETTDTFWLPQRLFLANSKALQANIQHQILLPSISKIVSIANRSLCTAAVQLHAVLGAAENFFGHLPGHCSRPASLDSFATATTQHFSFPHSSLIHPFDFLSSLSCVKLKKQEGSQMDKEVQKAADLFPLPVELL